MQEEIKGRTVDMWSVPSMTYTLIIRCLREGEDPLVNHYAAKVIENVSTTNTQHALVNDALVFNLSDNYIKKRNLPLEHNALLISKSCTWSFICPVWLYTAGHTKAFIYPVMNHWGESQSAPEQGRFEPTTCQ